MTKTGGLGVRVGGRLKREGMHEYLQLIHFFVQQKPMQHCSSYSSGSSVARSCSTLATPWTVACQAPPSIGFSRQEYWNGLPFPSAGDLPDLGIEPASPALQADFLLTEL